MHLTVKQIELLNVIARGDERGKPLDLDQVLDKLTYETTKQSLQFSVRAMVSKGLIFKRGVEKRRGRQRQVLEATSEGRQIAGVERPKEPAFVVDELTNELEGIVDEAENMGRF